MTTRKYYPEVDAKGRIIPEVAVARGVRGRRGAARVRGAPLRGRGTAELVGLRPPSRAG